MQRIQFKSIHRILVAVDFEETAKRAIEVAAELATRFDAKLTLVHVWDLPHYPYTSMASSMVRRAIEDAAHEAFDGLLASARAENPKLQIDGVLKHGSAGREIVELAQEISADLVIVGTHGRRGISRAMLGSIAANVVRTSPIPVLTVPGSYDVPRSGDASGG